VGIASADPSNAGVEPILGAGSILLLDSVAQPLEETLMQGAQRENVVSWLLAQFVALGKRPHEFFTAILFALLLTSCTDAFAPASRTLRPPPVVVRDMDALNTVSIQFSWEPLRRDTIASYAFGEGVLAAASIQSLLNVTSEASASCVHVNDGFDYKGVYTFCSGLEQCAWSASISSRGATVPLGLPCAEL